MTHLYAFDLTAHEQTRLAAVLEALGDDFDPIKILEGEHEARALLYNNLDAEQLAVYDELVRAGVLDEGSLR
jgi:Family of unknown function (DUF6400)